MIKTIKVKKKLRLDELIKYVWDNGLNSFQFTSDNNVDVYFSSNEHFLIAGDSNVNGRSVEIEDRFTVEVEEEITEDTEFEALVFILVSGRIEVINNYHNIRSARSLLENYETEKQIYALINGKLELIWEAEN